jgi:hypothetical protein
MGSDFARPEREQTSNGCPFVRKYGEPSSGRKANGRDECNVCIFLLFQDDGCMCVWQSLAQQHCARRAARPGFAFTDA